VRFKWLSKNTRTIGARVHSGALKISEFQRKRTTWQLGVSEPEREEASSGERKKKELITSGGYGSNAWRQIAEPQDTTDNPQATPGLQDSTDKATAPQPVIEWTAKTIPGSHAITALETISPLNANLLRLFVNTVESRDTFQSLS